MKSSLVRTKTGVNYLLPFVLVTSLFFPFSLFVIGCRLTCQGTAANPYVTVLGEPESSIYNISFV